MRMQYDYDMIVIGLGPAGMAVSVMGSEMGLRVCAIERHKIGGECMNAGCIPSKSLLRMAAARHACKALENMELDPVKAPSLRDPFGRIQQYLEYINSNKTSAMFKKVHLVLAEGSASFVDPHTVEAGGKRYSAKRIFICTGTRPAVPPIPGIKDVDVLTNENIFKLKNVPKSMVIIGGGAIGCEMAQAFTRLGCPCRIVHMDAHLLPPADRNAGETLEAALKREGVEVCNAREIVRVEKSASGVAVVTEQGERLEGERLLVAAGRRLDVESLQLDRAGVKVGKNAIEVNKHLQTSRSHIYAAGDCNGHALFSHAAMHQGMIALMNCMMPPFMRMDFRKYVVPWTVFTEPQVSMVGKSTRELDAASVKYETVTANYSDYGAAIAEGIAEGHVRAYIGPTGRIYGAQIIGEGSGEMINEWALAIQKKCRITDIMLLQHSFPSMSFLTKRVSEMWMMNRMKSPWLRRIVRWMY